MNTSSLNAAVIRTFGEAVTLHRAGLDDLPMTGIYSRTPLLDDAGGSARLNSYEVSVAIRDTDVTGRAPGQNDEVTARGERKVVIAAQSDGQGMTTLILRA